MDKKKPRYLSKTRFKEAWECPTKLFFTGKTEYGNTKLDNTFLEAIARGGFQVGKLAQLYHPGGIEIETLDSDAAISQTQKLLRETNVIIFEAAIQHGNLLARVDILVKNGSDVRLIEVKAKSFDPDDSDKSFFLKKQKKGQTQLPIRSTWEPYFVDVAFQTVVFERAYPELKVIPFLMLADTSVSCTVDGLNQQFFLEKDEKNRTKVVLSKELNEITLGSKLLREHDASAAVKYLRTTNSEGNPSFDERIDQYALAYSTDTKISAVPGKICKKCEYRISDSHTNLRNAFDECWHEAHGLTPIQLKQPLIFDLAGRFDKADQIIAEGRYFLADLSEADISPENESVDGFTQKQRQWEQIRLVKEQDNNPVIHRSALASQLSNFVFPLHMIDFETTTVAIPFNKGCRPYETIAFQFSHHVVHEDGRVEHKDEYIDRRRGVFPNFDFVRQLKKALEGDNGAIFRYSPHENTVLCHILEQLRKADPSLSDALTDRDELIKWVQTITHSTGKSKDKWKGTRDMIDLWDLAKSYYLHPFMQGSYSLKDVLPAILQDSKFLKSKYAKPIYGAEIPSHNFKNHVWIELDEKGQVKDPYLRLEPIFGREIDSKLERSDLLYDDESSIREGGAAMTAFAQMQFTQMTDAERERVCAALLRYCELDTLAMVFLYEYWREQSTRRNEP